MRNWLPLLALGKFEEAINILLDAANSAYVADRGSSTKPEERPLPSLKASNAQNVDRANLKKKIEAAVGPQDRHGHPGDNPNPRWTNDAPSWSYDFSDRLTVLLGDALDAVIKKALDADGRNLTAVASAIASAEPKDISSSLSVQLLWWRQALYSNSAKKPYRKLATHEAVLHAVFDLSELIPSAYESSLESFLVESIRAFNSDENTLEAGDFLRPSPVVAEAFRNKLRLDPPKGLQISGLLDSNAGAPLVVVKQSFQDWAVWIMREFAALKAIDATEAVGKEAADE